MSEPERKVARVAEERAGEDGGRTGEADGSAATSTSPSAPKEDLEAHNASFFAALTRSTSSSSREAGDGAPAEKRAKGPGADDDKKPFALRATAEVFIPLGPAADERPGAAAAAPAAAARPKVHPEEVGGREGSGMKGEGRGMKGEGE